MAGLPDEIKALAEFSPAEDLLLAVLRQGLPGIVVQSLIEQGQSFPFVLVRRNPTGPLWGGDMRFVDEASMLVHCFCEDPDGDEDAAILSEAVRSVLFRAFQTQLVIPGRGHITKLEMTSAPREVSDWSTSAGPVQYADLPTGVYRYEAKYSLQIRKPRTLTLQNH